MKMNRTKIHNEAETLSILIGLSGIATVLVFLRLLYADFFFLFLIWNLFLAWIPYILSILISLVRNNRIRVLLSIPWLLFLPNALYVITDLMHLQWSGGVPIWYDVMMFFTFAITCLFLGFKSLNHIQRLLMQIHSDLKSWLITTGIILLSSFGIYLGRFLRLNSWDVIIRPHQTILHITDSIMYPNNIPEAIAFTLLLSLVYVLLYKLIFIKSGITT